MYNRAKELYCDVTIFFFDSLLSTCPKKWKLKNSPRLLILPYFKEDYVKISESFTI